HVDPMAARVMTLFLLGIGAAEAALFLGIAVAVFRNCRTISIDKLTQLKG
ncbi:MAG TPA: NADH-quinone oxidoreductase subunit K, partial [Desulfobacterales bacterium]|nr:NADH-quinone oxidoreductase subunit K [Desulfobacterales bacterium]